MKLSFPDWVFTADYALPLLQGHFHTHSLDGFGLAGHTAAAIAAAALVHYVRSTKQGELQHLDGLKYYQRGGSLELDAVSVRNLELLAPIFSDDFGKNASTTLVAALDVTVTGMGARLLGKRDLQVTEAAIDRVDGIADVEAKIGCDLVIPRSCSV